jgi:hypothetical protein
MSDIAVGRVSASDQLFRLRTVALMVAIGITGFVGMLVMGAYEPDLRSGRDGGAHALSNAATGFSGIVRLAQATGRNPQIIRSEHALDSEDLLVLAPDDFGGDFDRILKARPGKATLVVLQKWQTSRDPDEPGWVQRQGLAWTYFPSLPLSDLKVTRIRSGGLPLVGASDLGSIRFVAPRPLQTISGKNIEPLITDRAGHVVLAHVGKGALYVLADPDLLSNIGMKDLAQARSALALLDWLNTSGAQSIGFDVTLNGFGHSRSPLRLAFDPPFLGMTLALAAALLLAGLYALGRFGPVRRRERAIAFGKAALIDNSAAIVRKARREARMGGRYAAVIRERAVVAFGVPARLRDAALDAYLDRLGGTRTFTDLVAQANAAEDRHALLAAAQALHEWKREKSR